MNIDSDNYLILGGNGFIGKEVCKELQKLPKNYVVSVDPTHDESFNCEDYVKIKESILDTRNICDLIDFHDVHYIANFAAIPSIYDCIENPILSMNTNLALTIYCLEAIRKMKKDITYVFASSVYACNNLSGPYGIYKRSSEDLIKFYNRYYGINYLILRYGTVYGKTPSKDNSIYLLIQKALESKIISYYGDGTETREYIHVSDSAKATIKAIGGYSNDTLIITGLHPINSKILCNTLKNILGPKYKVEFRNEKVLDHYTTTPYSAEVDNSLVRKIVLDDYVDFGSGLCEIIQDLKNAD